jgi:hypothetical protein
MMSQSRSVPVTVNSLGPFIVLYTGYPASANDISSPRGHGSIRQTCSR